MSFSAWQFQYNGLTFGASSNVGVSQVTGLGDIAAVRSGDVARPVDTGYLAGWDFLGQRTITITMQVEPADGSPGLAYDLDQVKAAFAPSQTVELPLQFMLPGQRPRIVNARCRKLSAPIDVTFEMGYAVVTVQLVASDPRIYDASPSTTSILLPTSASGMTFPATFPLGFGGIVGSGGVGFAGNVGNVETRPVLTIAGGVCTEPFLQNLTTGETLALSLSLTATDDVTVDMDAQTVYINGTGDRSSYVEPGSTFWTLQPGLNQIGFHSQDGQPTGATLTVSWRSAWL